MSSDFITTTDEKYVTQLGNLSAKAPTVQATLGLTAADIAGISADYSAMQAAVLDVVAKQTAAQSSTQAKNAIRLGTEKRLRALAKRIKGNANYTPALGELLGIVPPGGGSATLLRAMASENGARPQLRASVAGDGTVTVKFAKKGFTGVLLYGRRGEEQEFTLLSKRLGSPLVDARANASEGAPETRQYRAQFFRNDTAVGHFSDIAVVTVPASGIANTTVAIQPEAATVKVAA